MTHWYGWCFFVSSLFWPRLCLLGLWIFGSFMTWGEGRSLSRGS